jgi:hypothetical protein
MMWWRLLVLACVGGGSGTAAPPGATEGTPMGLLLVLTYPT